MQHRSVPQGLHNRLVCCCSITGQPISIMRGLGACGHARHWAPQRMHHPSLWCLSLPPPVNSSLTSPSCLEYSWIHPVAGFVPGCQQSARCSCAQVGFIPVTRWEDMAAAPPVDWAFAPQKFRMTCCEKQAGGDMVHWQRCKAGEVFSRDLGCEQS